MTLEAQELLQQALQLHPVERAELIEALFRSFETPADAVCDAAWAKEAESRIDAHEAGQIASTGSDEVIARTVPGILDPSHTGGGLVS
ncbi:MAG: addiction module protein [Elusimicrobia bacterium CG_4_9_14_3_um_filter_62_55]|nr:MAG: addiction module protein [Elusimicrobia bacterium CG22_combo_CG10-13_8_21_14_all_63_91]PJA13991.1 MAG: addiction module protein [Elusimicrobia bacterium CG_4_10_14_0_2_um_filter_63_34]PJB26451.1 MAG: addiction module protein [Elusimicrobia bacterium CG_4_9_14_3_um_filter_62_55]